MYAYTARWRAYSRSSCALGLGRRDRVLELGDVSRVSSSWWSAVENAAAVSLAAARASVSFCRAAARSSLVAAPAPGTGASAALTGRRSPRSRARRARRRGCDGGGSCSGLAPGDQGTLAAGRLAAVPAICRESPDPTGSFDGGLEHDRRPRGRPTRRTRAEVRTARPALRLRRARAALLRRDPRAAPRQAPRGLRRRGQHHAREARRGPRFGRLRHDQPAREEPGLPPLGPRPALAVLEEHVARRRRRARGRARRRRSNEHFGSFDALPQRSSPRPRSTCRARAGARSRGSRSASV